MKLSLWLLLLLPFIAPRLSAQDEEQEQNNASSVVARPQEEERAAPGIRFRMRPYPDLRFGKILRLEFHTKFQGDFRGFSPELQPKKECDPYNASVGCLFELNRARISVEGRFLKDFEFDVERELRDNLKEPKLVTVMEEGVTRVEQIRNPWRDVYVNYRHFRRFQIKAGKFKLPFSMEQLTGAHKLDLIFRSRIADLLAPGRDIGIMAHGRFFNRGLNYEAGLFKQDGENARDSRKSPTGERSFAGRLTATPLRLIRAPAFLKDLGFGGAFVSTTVPPDTGTNGLKGLRGRTPTADTFFPHIFVRGQRLRLGTELNWTPGPFSLKGEFIRVQEERRGQGFRGENIPDLIEQGWYWSGSWVVTGEKKAGGIVPRRAFWTERGIGAVELAARYEQIRYGSSEHPGRPSRSIRAANILENGDHVWSFGVNWYVNRWVKIQANGIREKFVDMERSPIPGQDRFWTRVVRLQFSM